MSAQENHSQYSFRIVPKSIPDIALMCVLFLLPTMLFAAEKISDKNLLASALESIVDAPTGGQALVIEDGQTNEGQQQGDSTQTENTASFENEPRENTENENAQDVTDEQINQADQNEPEQEPATNAEPQPEPEPIPTPTPAPKPKPAPPAPVAPVVPKAPFEEMNLRASSAFVYDIMQGKALFEKNADISKPLASITKVITALTARSIAPTGSVIVTGQHLSAEGDSGLVVGETWSVSDLANYMLVGSSNDGAEALTSVAHTRDGFIARMNSITQELGLASMSFNNPSGLDEAPGLAGGYGSARDIASLIAYILDSSGSVGETLDNSNKASYSTATDVSPKSIRNTNTILKQIPNIIASKTGFTTLAGGNLVIVFDAGEQGEYRPVIVVVLGSSMSGRFTDTQTLVKNAIRAITEI